MSKNTENEEFFKDLDKTTDLLRSFKPRGYEDSKTESLDSLYKDYKKLTEEEEIKTRMTKRNFNELSKEEKKEILRNLTPEQKEKLRKRRQEKLASQNKKTDIKEIVKKIDTNLKKEKEAQVIKEQKKKEEKKVIRENKTTTKKTGRRKLKDGVLQLMFISCSILFILGCCIYYGSRLIHYYKIYNPKGEGGKSLSLLTTSIAKNSTLVIEGEGLYMLNGEYVYKGKNVDNYVKYSNMLWRIIRTNQDGTIDLVLDDSINSLMWNDKITEYTKSDINDYLNNQFIKSLNKDLLDKTVICKDTVEEVKDFKCNSIDTSKYVRLLSINDFLNSKLDDKGTFMSDEKSRLWLNTHGNSLVWQINGNNLSLAESNRALSIKPVIKLKTGVALLSGKGTLEDPYIIEKDNNDIQVGDYITLGKDKWVVYEVNKNNIKLTTAELLTKTYRFDLNSTVFNPENADSIGYYLNNTYYNSLSYKDKLIESEWYVSNYKTSYKDVETDKVKAKVGLLNVSDLKLNSKLSDYFLLNGNDKGVYLYGNELITSKVAIYRGIRPAIMIKKSKVASGNGSIDKPFILEG